MKNEDNISSYHRLCESEKSIPLFMHPAWLDAVCDVGMTWHVALSKDEKGNIQAALVYCLKKKYGLIQVTMPHFTQFTGIWFHSQVIDNQGVIALDLLNQLKKAHRTYLRIQVDMAIAESCNENGFDVQKLHTQVILNLKETDKIYKRLSGNVKRSIKKAQQYFRIEVRNDFDTFYKINNNTFERQKRPNPIPLSIWKSTYTFIHQKGWGRVYFALDNSNEAQAVVMVVWDADTTYLLCNGSTDEGRKYGAMPQLIWQAIIDNIGQSNTFNFLGSMIPNIEAFNARFGAQKKAYFRIEKYQNKAIKWLFKLAKK
jgi:Acetyltransferase (GNAT) domain